MKRWRTKQLQITVTRKRVIVFVIRRFRTSPARHSKAFPQMVFWCELGSVREFAVQIRLKRRTQIPSTWQYAVAMSLMIIGLVGILFFGRAYAAKQIEPNKTFTVSQTSAQMKPLAPKNGLSASVPTHLRIPAVGIDADITPVGLAADGSIQMPPVLDWVTGWYKYSPTPGQIGPAIIVGHVDSYKNISVFWRLREVAAGNDIFITRSDGGTVQFKVTALSQVDQANFPTKQVYGNIDYPGLRLITCGGTFNQATGSYDQNTIVYATMTS